MYWYDETGKEKDVFVSTRVRLARNFTDYPFGDKLGKTGADEIVEKVKNVLRENGGYTYTVLSSIDEIQREAMVEKRIISPEFAKGCKYATLAENRDKKIYVMICEEDHLRIQTILPGFEPEEALKIALETDSLIDNAAKYAFDEKLGYLTHCPTNLGTGMRISVMMFLPALTLLKRMDSVKNELSRVGVTVRGSFGEGSDGGGALWQLSNSVTLGQTEEEIMQKLKEAVSVVAENERELRRELERHDSDRLKDKIMRSYGTMKYSHLLSSSEMMKLYSDVRLGIILGYISGISAEALDMLLISSLPANLEISAGKELSDRERDIIRAKNVKEALPL